MQKAINRAAIEERLEKIKTTKEDKLSTLATLQKGIKEKENLIIAKENLIIEKKQTIEKKKQSI